MTTYDTLRLEQIGSEVEDLVRDVVDGYFQDDRIDRMELFDRVEAWLVQDGKVLPSNMEDPVCKKIVAIARKHKKEMYG